MTKIKLCGLFRPCDIEAANGLMPEYIGFVFASKSPRYIYPQKAAELRLILKREIKAVGVFVGERAENIADLLNAGVIDIAQLHGGENEEYIKSLRYLTDKPIIKAFRIDGPDDVRQAEKCSADYVLLDSGNGGTGTAFEWELIKNIKRPYFLAGGLDAENVGKAVNMLKPYAVDVSSGIETNGLKDGIKMADFVAAVRKEDEI